MLCCIVTEQEDKINISIDGLTKKQKMMLSIIWSIDSREQLHHWLYSLNIDDRRIVSSLLIMLKYEVMEEILDEDCLEAKEILSKFISME